MAIVGDVFGLNAVYDRQVENITNNNFTSWPETNSYGYYAGGSPNISTISKIDFASETVTNPANLPTGWSDAAAASNGLYGYFAGGYIPSFIASDNIFKFDFSDETVSIAKYLPGGTVDMGSVSSSSYGYVAGGFIPSLPASNRYRSEIYRLDFSTSTSLTSKGYLPSTMDNLTGTESDNYGYFAGGTNPTWRSTISRIDFSNETISLPGNDLPTATTSMTASDNDVYGYLAGGFTFTPPELISTILRLDFSNETLSNPGNNLPATRSNMAATENSEYGYFSGGGGTSIILRFSFSTETLSSPGNLPSVRSAHAAVSGGQSVARGNGYKTYGYFCGGFAPSIRSDIVKYEYSTDTRSGAGNLPAARYDGATIESRFTDYGYISGGKVGPTPTPSPTSIVTRLDFRSETSSNPGLTLPAGNIEAQGTESGQYGYHIGGIGAGNSHIRRLDFSSESFTTVGFTPGNTISGASEVQNDKYAYFSCGEQPGISPSSFTCSINRFDFSTETFNLLPPASDRFSRIINGGGLQSNLYGYVCGGQLLGYPVPGNTGGISKLDFATEILSPSSPSLPTGFNYVSAVSGDYHGYIAGGFTPPFISTATKLNFSDGTTSSVTSLPNARAVIPELSN